MSIESFCCRPDEINTSPAVTKTQVRAPLVKWLSENNFIEMIVADVYNSSRQLLIGCNLASLMLGTVLYPL